jgi:hypothetical protein
MDFYKEILKMKKNKLRIKKSYILVFVFYFVLSLFYMKQLIPVMDHGIYTGVSGDGQYYLWNFWWFKEAILENFQNPLSWTDMLFYPFGRSLVLHESTTLLSLLSIPLQYFFGLITIYNMFCISSLFLSAISMFFFMKEYQKDEMVAFICGALYGFSSFQFSMATAWPQTGLIFLFPLYLLFLFRIKKDPKNRRNAAYLSILLFLILLSSYYNLLGICVFTVFLLVGQLFFKEIGNRKLFFKRVLASSVIFLVLSLPIIVPVFQEFLQTDVESRQKSVDTVNFVSLDLSCIFYPCAPLEWLGVEKPQMFTYVNNTLNEFHTNRVFLGYTFITILIFSFLKTDRKRILYLSLISLFYLLFIMGPSIFFGQKFLVENYFYRFLYDYVPFIRQIYPGLWFVYLLIILVMISSYGLKSFFSMKKKFFSKKDVNSKLIKFEGVLFSVLIVLLYTFEIGLASKDMIVDLTPKAYNDYLGDYQYYNNISEDFGIVNVPFDDVECGTNYMYYQTLNGKKMLNYGTLESRTSAEIKSRINYYKDYFSLENNMSMKGFLQELLDLNIRLIIFHENACRPSSKLNDLFLDQRYFLNRCEPVYWGNDTRIYDIETLLNCPAVY